jgi:hypothetical protein
MAHEWQCLRATTDRNADAGTEYEIGDAGRPVEQPRAVACRDAQRCR